MLPSRLSIPAKSLHGLCILLILTVVGFQGHAQMLPSLKICRDGATNFSLEISGTVGVTYSLDYKSDAGWNDGVWNVGKVLTLPVSPFAFSIEKTSNTTQRFFRLSVVNIQPVTNMIWVSSGTFLMGSPLTESRRSTNELQHLVTLSQGFWMGKFEVTQGEYTSLTGTNPSLFRNGTNAFGSGGTVTNEVLHPVEKVSWFDAMNYCAQLTATERGAGRLPSDWEYRLPTESEWEYVCRAGTTTSHHYGDGLFSGQSNFRGTFEYDAVEGFIQNPDGEYLGRTSEVGGYDPNLWGFYDMHGNVWEWCLDWRGDYPVGPVTDPTGASTGLSRVVRGGEWGVNGWYARSARRFSGDPSAGKSNTGFRIVLAPVRRSM